MSSAQRCKHCGYTREEHDDPSEFVPQELPTSNQRLECITLPNNSVVIDGTAYDHLAQVAQENVNLRAQLSCATAELAWAEECGRKRDAGETSDVSNGARLLAVAVGLRISHPPSWLQLSPHELQLIAEAVTKQAESAEKANAHDSWCLCSDCLDKRGRQEAAEKTSPAHECEFIPFQNAPGYEMCPGCSAVRPTSPRRGEQP